MIEFKKKAKEGRELKGRTLKTESCQNPDLLMIVLQSY